MLLITIYGIFTGQEVWVWRPEALCQEQHGWVDLGMHSLSVTCACVARFTLDLYMLNVNLGGLGYTGPAHLVWSLAVTSLFLTAPFFEISPTKLILALDIHNGVVGINLLKGVELKKSPSPHPKCTGQLDDVDVLIYACGAYWYICGSHERFLFTRERRIVLLTLCITYFTRLPNLPWKK